MVFLVLILFVRMAFSDLPNIWINEIHYDDAGTDLDEFVEVVAPEAFSELSSITLTFYNGTDGKEYASSTLDAFADGETVSGFKLYYLEKSGIQNGAPDGLSLDYNGSVIQFLSYEGDFIATEGPANGLLSVDIGVSESDATLEGQSLQLQGNGARYNHFSWFGPLTATKGTPNEEQALPVRLSFFQAIGEARDIRLIWRTESEIDLLGFILDRRINGGEWQRRASYLTHSELSGQGSSSSPRQYEFIDDRVEQELIYEYRLSTCDVNGSATSPYLAAASMSKETAAVNHFSLQQNYPNPFNPLTTITFELPQEEFVDLTVFNAFGQFQQLLFQGMMKQGIYKVAWDGSAYPAGIYFFELRSALQVLVRKGLLVK